MVRHSSRKKTDPPRLKQSASKSRRNYKPSDTFGLPAPKKPKPAYRIEFFKGSGVHVFFARLCSTRNGRVIAISEGYSTSQARSKTWKPIAESLRAPIVNVTDPIPEAPDPGLVLEPTPELAPSADVFPTPPVPVLQPAPVAPPFSATEAHG